MLLLCLINLLFGIYLFFNFNLYIFILYLPVIAFCYFTLIDEFFRIKYIKNNDLPYNFYPSNRYYNKLILKIIIFVEFMYLIYIYYYIIINKHYDLNSEYMQKTIIEEYGNINGSLYQVLITFLIAISLIMLVLFVLFVIGTIYCVINDFIYNFLYNKTQGYPIKNKNVKEICWLCQTEITEKSESIIVSCKCNEKYHTKCINEYLGYYNNTCPYNHKVSKYIHSA